MQSEIMDRQILLTKVILPSVLIALLVTLTMATGYYSLLVYLMGGVRMANAQLSLYGTWMAILLFGFAVQLSLFFYQSRFAKFLSTACDRNGKQVAASGGTTGVAMLACCAHHLFEILPFVGIGAVGLFFGRFQFQFIELGIAANFIGILFMMSGIQRHRLYPREMNQMFARVDFKKLMMVFSLVASAYIVFSVLRSLS